MRRLVNTFLIEMNRPEGFIERQYSASQPFGTLYSRDQRLEGFVLATGFICSSLRDESQTFGTV